MVQQFQAAFDFRLHGLGRVQESRFGSLGIAQVGAANPNVDIVGVGVAPGQQAPEEPAHLLMQLPRLNQWPMGRVLRALPRPRHAARQGAEGRHEKEAQGDLRGHEGRGSVRRVGRFAA